jgi:predicted Zn-dependent protease
MKSLVAFALLCLASIGASQATDEDKRKKESEDDVKLGKEYITELEKSLKFSEDAAAIERVTRIGKEIADISNAHHFPEIYGDRNHHKFDYIFKVVEDDDVNAFSVPGGFIYVHTGLLKNVESDDELAAVLAHEVAHAANRHLRTLIRERSKIDLATLPLILAALLGGSKDAVPAVMAAELAKQSLTSGWSQQAENDADTTGFWIITKSRYNATGILTFIERLAYRERNSAQFDWGIYRTHPPSQNRAKSLRTLLTKENISIERSKVTTSFRAACEAKDGATTVSFGDRRLFVLRGSDAEARGAAAAEALNRFFDSSPELFTLKLMGTRLVWKSATLVEFTDADGAPDALATEAFGNVRNAAFSLSIRTSR